MNFRVFITLNLIAMASILLFLPAATGKKFYLTPNDQVNNLSDENIFVSIDKATQYINQSDSVIQFIDIRSPEEFATCNLPGSINIPYSQLLDKRWQGYLNQEQKTNILYSNGNVKSNMAYVLLSGMGYKNNFILDGGMNKWFEVVMSPQEFKGGRLSARENSILENRRKARELFTAFNSVPDSIRNSVLTSKILEEKKLDGGCE